MFYVSAQLTIFLGKEFGSQQLFPLHEFFSERDALLCSQVCKEVRCGSKKRTIKERYTPNKRRECILNMN